MTAEEKTKSARRMTASISAARRGFSSECAGYVRSDGGPQHSVHAGGVCRPATKAVDEPAPIWMAALLATPCQAVAGESDHAVRWNCVSGRAMYTNHSAEAELIQPLGVRLQGGDTLAVSWMPGETSYTLEVYDQRAQYFA